jgi:hypothetical protein
MRYKRNSGDRSGLSVLMARDKASGVRIVLHNCTVRVVVPHDAKLDVPRRQGFAWPKNAEAYAKRLSRERGWPIVDELRAKPEGAA